MHRLVAFLVGVVAGAFITWQVVNRLNTFPQGSNATGGIILRESQRIPKTIHFVYGLWDDFDKMPPTFQETIDAWGRVGFKTKLWNRDMCEGLLTSRPEYGKYIAMYRKFPRNVQRADFIRYLIVYDQGGFYMDLDANPGHVSLYDHGVMSYKKAVFFVEVVVDEEFSSRQAEVHPIREGVPEAHERIANYAFGSTANHVALKLILGEVERRWLKFQAVAGDPDYYVLFTTGPSAVTRALLLVRMHKSLHVFEKEAAHSLVNHTSAGTWRSAKDV